LFLPAKTALASGTMMGGSMMLTYLSAAGVGLPLALLSGSISARICLAWLASCSEYLLAVRLDRKYWALRAAKNSVVNCYALKLVGKFNEKLVNLGLLSQCIALKVGEIQFRSWPVGEKHHFFIVIALRYFSSCF
jgi:hypothetical protein